ncbi:hypothetical protein M408DRAFT_73897 [Serendipita vermifera MAFF 305830]|uniref:Uncharacterized protein n=1 Tax=Serendipita vermifera MAFF 305830 TaxID=933852 RepID=A0A0C2WHF9_SERVB|nr:hypothetical protein M408DRAFT_73897 [Serendipita vermifera MAFF 305830]
MDPDTTEPTEHITEHKQLATFERYDEFKRHLDVWLHCDLSSTTDLTEAEKLAWVRLEGICNEYQEQSFLLDPWLNELLVPPVELLRRHVTKVVNEKHQNFLTWRLFYLNLIIYQIIKTRGYKTIVPFFPHEVSDLDVALTFIEQYQDSDLKIANSWAIPYIMLLWLSLICRLPFDLASFDEIGSTSSTTVQRIESLGRLHLNKAGIDRDSAALLLSKLYTRSDTQVLFKPFLEWCDPILTATSEVFQALGCLQTISEVLKSAGKDQIGPYLPLILDLVHKAIANSALAANTTIRKQCIKITGRVGLTFLPATSRIQTTARHLQGTTASNEGFAQTGDDSEDVPDEIEGVVDEMLIALRDRVRYDTTIRWSAAKYMARIASRVPSEFADQLLDAVMEVYTVHYVQGEELNPITEPSWHGATLACAEFARQGLINKLKVATALEWVLKALSYDVRKGSHSIGSNVRDAACYFLWSLPRTQDPEVIRPYAERLAQSLMTAALFDREVHIRRAASAAFQENVGRMGLFPHGIDLLKWADFHGVGVRRSAFLVAAPEVAKHLVYRDTLINHLAQTTLKHWDKSMREIGSEALGNICQPDLDQVAPGVIGQLKQSLAFVDDHEIHGAVLGLREMSEAFRRAAQNEDSSEARWQVGIFELIDNLREPTLKSYRNDILLEASCLLISSSISQIALVHRPDLDVKSVPRWRFILDLGLKHRNEVVQRTAAQTVGVLSNLRSSDKDTKRYVYPYFQLVLKTLLDGLEDYSVDERGDVGSWVRISSLQGLSSSVELILRSDIRNPNDWLPQELYLGIWAGMLKQGAERLDNVRAEVGKGVVQLLEASTLKANGNVSGSRWIPCGYDLLRQLFMVETGSGEGWNQPAWLFPRIVQVLQVPEYRSNILKGLVLSIGSRNEGTHRPAATALTEYLIERDTAFPNERIIDAVFKELLDLAKANSASNTVVLPILSTFDALIEGSVVAEPTESEERANV